MKFTISSDKYPSLVLKLLVEICAQNFVLQNMITQYITEEKGADFTRISDEVTENIKHTRMALLEQILSTDGDVDLSGFFEKEN